MTKRPTRLKSQPANPIMQPIINDVGTQVRVIRSDENWSECELEDGTILRVKPVIMEVRKLSIPDSHGNPGFNVRSTLITDVTLPEKSKAKTKK